MRIGRKTAALFLAVFVSASAAIPAFASHKVIDKDTYIIETNEDEETTCTYVESGKPVTGWIEDEDENLYYYDHGVMNHGWDKIRGEWYYFDPETGILATNTTVLNNIRLQQHHRGGLLLKSRCLY